MSEPDDPLLVGARQLLFAENVRDFNRLRERHPNLRIVLRRENLSGLRLAGIDLHGALLECANLTDCALAEACFDGATLLGCQARQGDFRGASFVGARLESYKPLAGADTGDVRQRTVFAGADLRGADLSRARLTGIDLGGADLSEACLAGATLETVDLQGTVLRQAEAPHLLLRGNTAYLARTWGTKENPGPKPGEGPLLEGCNAFGMQLVNSTDPSVITRPDWRPDGVRNDDPRQNEKARNSDEEEETAMATTPDRKPLSTYDRVKTNASKGALRFGARKTLSIGRDIIMKGVEKTGIFEPAVLMKIRTGLESEVGTGITAAVVSAFLRTGVLDKIPMIPKEVRGLLQGPVAEELEIKSFDHFIEAASEYVVPLIGEFGGALTAMAATMQNMTEEENGTEALPAGNHPGIAVEQRDAAPVPQATDKG